MRRVLAILFLCLPTLAGALDMGAYLKETEQMVGRGQYPEALERFLWFHDHSLEHDPAMYGVRLSFALSSWKSLADKYRPAYDAMVQVRDRKTALLLSEGTTHTLFHDVEALNQTLGEDDRTIQLFERLDAERPVEAKMCFEIAKDALFEAGRHDLVAKYIGNPMDEFIRARAMYDMNTSFYGDERLRDSDFREFNEDSFVKQSLRLIDLIKESDPATAQDIQRKALSVVDDLRLREALPGHPPPSTP